jgi:hypothetical protein
MVLDVGISDMLSIAQTIGIVGTLLIALFLSRKEVREPSEWSNNAHIAYNTGWIAEVSGRVLVPALQQEASRTDLSSADKQTARMALDEAIAVRDDAKQLKDKSENSTTPDDISDEVGDYVTPASYSQIIFTKIKEIGEELKGEGDVEKVNGIVQSIADKAPELGKPVGRPQSIASKFKEAIGNFKTTLESKFKGLTGKISRKLKNTFAGLLKKSADLLQEFFTRLVGALFGFASWIQKIALKNNFSVNELSFELPSFEFSLLMVGPFPIPVPKLTTPKLSATFVPITAAYKKP